jgi:DNA-binding transcriptional LysR family regulator
LFREPLFLAVADGHPLARKPAVDLRELAKEPLLLLKEGHCLRDSVLMACTRAKAELRSIFESDQLESIFQLIKSGFGVTLVPEMASSHAAGCALVPLQGTNSRRIGYLSSTLTCNDQTDARTHLLAARYSQRIILQSSSKYLVRSVKLHGAYLDPA